MSLLELKNIGKIYASEGSVAVGIRGVNLSFDKGEFVAVTGESGSGKSTLLNVISGMDTYEEGELFIEGQPTSHYGEKDREAYREKYISFIFQDYNILESFTVLQNVELALLQITDKAERRARALELLRRVGLEGQLHQKGSKLSGGQKQRTVIARALAKDSPIILADEPTGNLDSKSAREIVALLEEVSRDKLLIVVTHNVEEVEHCATRRIRIFDGAVESDDRIGLQRTVSQEETIPSPGQEMSAVPSGAGTLSQSERKENKRREMKNGRLLGRAMFTAKPKLSIFLCLLLILGALGLFAVTGSCGEIPRLLGPSYMFTYVPGRVVLTRQDGQPLSDSELDGLVRDYGAERALHYDSLLDNGTAGYVSFRDDAGNYYYDMGITYGKTYDGKIEGRYPEKDNELFLYLPISYRNTWGTGGETDRKMYFAGTAYQVVGWKYYYDNNLSPECLMTEEGIRALTALEYLQETDSQTVNLTLTAGQKSESWDLTEAPMLVGSFALHGEEYYVRHNQAEELMKTLAGQNPSLVVSYNAVRTQVNYAQGGSRIQYRFSYRSMPEDRLEKMPEESGTGFSENSSFVIISMDKVQELALSQLSAVYRQASLFFRDDEAAQEAAAALRLHGYVAACSDTTYAANIAETITNTLEGGLLVVLWGLTVIFLAFFIHLCSARAIEGTRGEMAILRSMGIPVRTIWVAMFSRMYLSMIPAVLTVVLSAVMVFTSPKANELITFLYPWQYGLIFLGLFIITTRVTRKQIGKLYGQSVKNALRGGFEA